MKPNEIESIKLEYVRGRRTDKMLFDNSWRLIEPLPVHLSNGDVIVIPKGFETDFSSIPEFMWSIMKPFGDFLLAPIVHDWMYRNDYKVDEIGWYKARLFADKEMLYISKQTNSKKWHNRLDNNVRYFFVRIFGGLNYKKDTK